VAHRSKNHWLALTLVCGLLLPTIAARGLAAESAPSKPAPKSPYAVQPVLETPADLYFDPDGYLKGCAEAITRGWLLVMEQNNPEMFDRFRTAGREPFGDRLPWDGEFPGKHLTGAVEIYRTTHNKALYQSIHDFVGRLVALQQPNGYLGVWAPQYELTGRGQKSTCGEITWDMWNHNHILLGLIAWYEESGDERALQCACRIADLFCAKFLGKTGEWGSLPEPYTNLSPAHTLALLYRWTHQQKYLDLAKQVLAVEAPKCGLDFAARAKQGEDYCRKSTGAGGTRWETLHLLLAYSEMYLLTGDADYRTVIDHYWRSLTRTDRHNNGGFSSLESACGNPFDTRSVETCCTVAYTALGVEALRLTGDSRVADQLEISAMNAGLAFFSRDGQCSTYNTVMEGRIVPCDPNRRGNPNPGIYCCTVNAPRGVGMISHWALMADADGLAVNWYGPGVMTASVDGNRIAIAQIKNYPREDSVRFVVNPENTGEYTLKFRIPFWSEETRLTVNGEALPTKAGSYAAIKRVWTKGDIVDIAFQMLPRCWAGEAEYAGRASLYRGPVLLAHPISAPRENAAFQGDWTDCIRVRETQYFSLVGSETKGDCASFKFQGDWVAWRYNQCNVGGLARVFVDGKLLDTVDCYAENDMKDFFAYDRGQKGFFLSDRWQRDGFGPGEHTLVIEATGEKTERSQGAWVYLREFHDGRTDPKLDAASLAFQLLPANDPLGLDVRVATHDIAGNEVELKDYDAASKNERVFLTWFQIDHVPQRPKSSNNP